MMIPAAGVTLLVAIANVCAAQAELRRAFL
jgi:hypothetical protein